MTRCGRSFAHSHQHLGSPLGLRPLPAAPVVRGGRFVPEINDPLAISLGEGPKVAGRRSIRRLLNKPLICCTKFNTADRGRNEEGVGGGMGGRGSHHRLLRVNCTPGVGISVISSAVGGISGGKACR